MMNRRSFIKRIAAVATGVVVVLMMAKRLPFRPNPVQRNILHTWEISHIGGKYDGYQPPSEPSTAPDYPLGTYYHAPNGTIYKYVKFERYYVNNTKNIVRHTT